MSLLVGVSQREYEQLRHWLIGELIARGAGDDAEDVADEAIVRAWRQERTGRVLRPGYLRLAGLNLLTDRWRKRAQPRGDSGEPRYRYLPLTQTSAVVEAPNVDGVDDVERLLEGLDERDRQSLLGSMAGYTCREIGAAVGVSDWAVRMRLLRLRRRARAREEAS